MPLTGPSPPLLTGPVGMATGLLSAIGPWESMAELAPARAGGLLNAAGPCDATPDEVPKKGGGTAVAQKGSRALEASGSLGTGDLW